MGVAPVNFIQLILLLALVAGSVLHINWLTLLASGLMVLSTLLLWHKLLRMAKFFVIAAAVSVLVIGLFVPQDTGELQRAAVQGTSFAALMMVLGMLRYPVRRSARVHAATAYLTSYPPRHRYAVVNVGAHMLSLLFNVGIITMMGDLLRKQQEAFVESPSRRALVLGAMRGAALVSIWSPLGLGFAIVTAAIPALDPLIFLVCTLLFTVVTIGVTSYWPMLPADAMLTSDDAEPVPSDRGSVKSLWLVLGICLFVLLAAIVTHIVLDISFTMASVMLLPVFAVVWLLAENPQQESKFLVDIKNTVSGLSNMCNEGAIFLSANIVGTAIALLAAHIDLPIDINTSSAAALPVFALLLGLLIIIPISAACFLPNSIVVVIVAQLLGMSVIGQTYPLALGLMLAVAWANAISVSPISAMSLLTGKACGVSSRTVAYVWNLKMVLLTTCMAALTMAVLMFC